jgi:transcriptional regulator of acetoin/glycerol metabolism
MRTRAQLRRRRSTLAQAWDQNVRAIGGRAAREPLADVRAEIASSWQRSARHVSPDVTQALLADGGDTRAAWESSPLSAAVRRLEAELRATADDGDLVVAVTDPGARILWTHGGSAMRRQAEKVNFVPGGRWDEASVGTNALDLALRLDHTATVYSAEHFSSCVHDWVCYAAPVHDPDSGQQLGVLDLSTTWDRAHPIGPSTARALARLLEGEIRPASAGPQGTGHALLDLRLLGTAAARLDGRLLRITRRQTEILALLALSPEGLDLGELHARLYGDRPVSPGTLKAEMSQQRALLGGRLASRPYRLDLPVRCDVSDVLDRLRAGDVAGAAQRYGGELLSWSESPALVEYGNFVTVALRTALLADPRPAAVLRYTEAAPYDLELLERCAPA